mmetsp:Transcript_28664/g.71977  ORF Transcript_28664/g.71977 Transcript_28664/m.71977 type:complete len:167 (+) Transcript_28664:34-534(+)
MRSNELSVDRFRGVNELSTPSPALAPRLALSAFLAFLFILVLTLLLRAPSSPSPSPTMTGMAGGISSPTPVTPPTLAILADLRPLLESAIAPSGPFTTWEPLSEKKQVVAGMKLIAEVKTERGVVEVEVWTQEWVPSRKLCRAGLRKADGGEFEEVDFGRGMPMDF